VSGPLRSRGSHNGPQALIINVRDRDRSSNAGICDIGIGRPVDTVGPPPRRTALTIFWPVRTILWPVRTILWPVRTILWPVRTIL